MWPLFSKSLKKNHKIHSAPEARQNTFLHFTSYQIKVYSYSAVELNSCSIALLLYLEGSCYKLRRWRNINVSCTQRCTSFAFRITIYSSILYANNPVWKLYHFLLNIVESCIIITYWLYCQYIDYTQIDHIHVAFWDYTCVVCMYLSTTLHTFHILT